MDALTTLLIAAAVLALAAALFVTIWRHQRR
jgi:hypothetical protein